MPASVILVALILLLDLVLHVLGGIGARRPFVLGYHCAAAGVACVLLVYVIQGHPLARRWAIVVSILVLVFAVSLLSGGTARRSTAQLADVGLQIALASAVIALLRVESSLRYFDLRCPFCGVYQAKAENFLLSRIKCKNCQRAWKVHDHGGEVGAQTLD